MASADKNHRRVERTWRPEDAKAKAEQEKLFQEAQASRAAVAGRPSMGRTCKLDSRARRTRR